jgi:hypothetical protein
MGGEEYAHVFRDGYRLLDGDQDWNCVHGNSQTI